MLRIWYWEPLFDGIVLKFKVCDWKQDMWHYNVFNSNPLCNIVHTTDKVIKVVGEALRPVASLVYLWHLSNKLCDIKKHSCCWLRRINYTGETEMKRRREKNLSSEGWVDMGRTDKYRREKNKENCYNYKHWHKQDDSSCNNEYSKSWLIRYL